MCRSIVGLLNHVNDTWSQLVSEQLMHKMSFKLFRANGKGKRAQVLYSAVQVTLFLELSSAGLKANEKTKQVLVVIVHYCAFG